MDVRSMSCKDLQSFLTVDMVLPMEDIQELESKAILGGILSEVISYCHI